LHPLLGNIQSEWPLLHLQRHEPPADSSRNQCRYPRGANLSGATECYQQQPSAFSARPQRPQPPSGDRNREQRGRRDILRPAATRSTSAS
jgi:hypothetical protein